MQRLVAFHCTHSLFFSTIFLLHAAFVSRLYQLWKIIKFVVFIVSDVAMFHSMVEHTNKRFQYLFVNLEITVEAFVPANSHNPSYVL